jgi:NAD(P)-dependent dehydrogenase (short-subunit alcohol dehydrogenase family)
MTFMFSEIDCRFSDWPVRINTGRFLVPALVTGAGRGLGRVMALALLRAGHRGFLTSTDMASLEETGRAGGANEQTAIATNGPLILLDDAHLNAATDPTVL